MTAELQARGMRAFIDKSAPFATRARRIAAWLDSPTLAKAAIAFIAAVLLTLLRRPDQFLHPAVWVEDGAINLPDFINYGWRSVFFPVQGYFVWPARLIHVVGMSISVAHYPGIASALNVIVCAGCVTAVAMAPTVLRGRLLCAILILLVPTEPEAFGVSLYAFWWTSILALVAVLWREDGGHMGARCALTAMGGLSSPLIVGILPIFVVRLIRQRNRAELFPTLVAACAAATQLTVILLQKNQVDGRFDPRIAMIVRKYIGYFFMQQGAYHDAIALILGWLVIVGVALFTAWRWREGQWGWVYLSGVWAVAIAISMARVPLEIVHPVYGGPRYFFFPYICTIWFFVTLLCEEPVSARGLIAAAALTVGLVQRPKVLTIHHIPLDWMGSIKACASGEASTIPIHFDGLAEDLWHVPLTREQCQKLMAR